MKKLLLLSLCSLLFAGAAQAADLRNEWGLLAGVNLAKLHTSVSELGQSLFATGDATSGSSDTKTGFLAGAYADFQVADGLFFEPQLRFNKRGGASDSTDSPGSRDYVSLNYLEIPVYAKYKFENTSAILPYLFAGPRFGFRVGFSSYTKDANGNITSETNDATNAKDFDFSLDAGLGAEVQLNESWSIGASAAYSWGMLNLLKSGGDLVSISNRGLEIYGDVGLSF